MPEAYDQNYEDELFARLAPKIEATVAQSFQGRGANFGAEKAMKADRLAKLRTEIALASAEKRFEQAEKIRGEGVLAAREEKARQTRAGELARTGAPVPVAVVQIGRALAPPPTRISVVAPAARVCCAPVAVVPAASRA